jgi:glycosyltransferase involved in cell wall biosynthesis
VVGISVSATTEFRGFADALASQGLDGPRVVECLLPAEAPHTLAAGPAGDPPVVLSVGSHEPRKNHLSLLHAAEVLWREGLRFELRLVGGSGWSTQGFDQRVEELQRAGRPVRVERSVGDDELWQAYAQARFSVFTSLHEGYGLPVAESLACGTPVVTTSYGSTAEIAAGGGAVLVDPRQDAELVAAMRTLLTDDAELGRLREQARRREPRTWADYADELWDDLLAPVPQAVLS